MPIFDKPLGVFPQTPSKRSETGSLPNRLGGGSLGVGWETQKLAAREDCFAQMIGDGGAFQKLEGKFREEEKNINDDLFLCPSII